MNTYDAIINKMDSSHEIAYSLIRIFLGIALFSRGLLLITNPESIRELASEDQLFSWYAYIAIAHLLGGLLLTLGFYVRLAAFIQIPILFGAVFLVHLKNGLVMGGQSLELAALVLFLLINYVFFGSGKYTITSLFGKNPIVEKRVADVA